jgi:hypothetical protein
MASLRLPNLFLVLLIGLPVAAANRSTLYLEQRERCLPFLPAMSTKDQWAVTGGSGKVVKSSHPNVLPIGKGNGLTVSSGAYNPEKKQITLVVENRYIVLFLQKSLTEANQVNFTATTCGFADDSAPLIHSLIQPGLFFGRGDASISGTLKKSGNKISGVLKANSPFYLSDAAGFPGLRDNAVTNGSAEVGFTLGIKPGRSSNFPEPKRGSPIRGLW